MCGRFALKTPTLDLIQMFELVAAENVAQRMNIAPGQPVLTIRQEASGRKATHLKWGLVPSWAKDPAIAHKMINARSETLQDKPSFRSAYRQRRCLIPADGFYEWQKQGRKKQPYYIHRKDEKPFAMAGLWESWQGPTGQAIETCIIITTEANAILRQLHDRMPVIMEPLHWALWLSSNSTVEMLQKLLCPAKDEILAMHPVSGPLDSLATAPAGNVELTGPDTLWPTQ